ncbi:uncharacterized protein F5147DRAFT_763832 [Suillus discolor]|uniref:DUF6533 domain-containing protein n=1 Tax=Suillus discolor TaxID=1912936 RepID=A0A9P7EY98_9AGAM|nr:uncharacterized protein F5147DRAFT_763832 [Suillus discolor]KAG2094861.1 hypothetical protein F5147DRAFT_763832 [Suillus discolor]
MTRSFQVRCLTGATTKIVCSRPNAQISRSKCEFKCTSSGIGSSTTGGSACHYLIPKSLRGGCVFQGLITVFRTSSRSRISTMSTFVTTSTQYPRRYPGLDGFSACIVYKEADEYVRETQLFSPSNQFRWNIHRSTLQRPEVCNPQRTYALSVDSGDILGIFILIYFRLPLNLFIQTYDYICSLHVEWTFLLRSRLTKVKALYIIARYVPFFIVAADLVYMNFSRNEDRNTYINRLL